LQSAGNAVPVGLVQPVLLIVDGTHLLADDACNLLHELCVPSCCQTNWLREEGGSLGIVPWHPHAMQALCATATRAIVVSHDNRCSGNIVVMCS